MTHCSPNLRTCKTLNLLKVVIIIAIKKNFENEMIQRIFLCSTSILSVWPCSNDLLNHANSQLCVQLYFWYFDLLPNCKDPKFGNKGEKIPFPLACLCTELRALLCCCIWSTLYRFEFVFENVSKSKILLQSLDNWCANSGENCPIILELSDCWGDPHTLLEIHL